VLRGRSGGRHERSSSDKFVRSKSSFDCVLLACGKMTESLGGNSKGVIASGIGTEDVGSVFIIGPVVEEPIIELVVEVFVEGGIIPIWGDRLFVVICEELFVGEGDILVKESLFEMSGSRERVSVISVYSVGSYSDVVWSDGGPGMVDKVFVFVD
jgi:hypothetical protein